MNASSPITWPEAPAGVTKAQREPHGETAAGRHPVADRASKARKPKRGQPDREPGLKRANFGRDAGLPTLLLLPQFLILLFFFFIPSLRALMQSVLLSDPFGNNVQLVWFDNFTALFANGEYRQSIVTTVWFTVVQNVITLAVAVVLAFATDRVVEAHLLRLYLSGRRPVGGAGLADGSRRRRRRRTDPALPAHRAADARADRLLPRRDELHLRLLRNLRHHRCRHPWRAGRRDQHPGLQGLRRRFRQSRPRLLGGAVGSADDVCADLHAAAIPLFRPQGQLRGLTAWWNAHLSSTRSATRS